MESDWRKISTSLGTTIASAMRQIDDTGRQGLIVVAGQRLVGVLTDGDLRRALMEGAISTEPIDPYVSRESFFILNGSPETAIRSEMRRRGLRIAPIVDDRMNVISFRDALHWKSDFPESVSALIMAGGRGERLRPITDITPKPLIAVGGKSMLQRVVTQLVDSGVQVIWIATHYLRELVEEEARKCCPPEVQLNFVSESTPLGTLGAARIVSLISHSSQLLVVNADVTTTASFAGLAKYHLAAGNDATLLLSRYTVTVPFGVVEEEDNCLSSFTEKPDLNFWVASGVALFSNAALQGYGQDIRFGLPDFISDAMTRGMRIGLYKQEDGTWLDIGTPESLSAARRLVQSD